MVLSTVDQIGSRLLFRGYGVSDRARPMHAGLFAFDTLLLLDEAHIAEPFQQTLGGIVREQGRAANPWAGGPRPLSWVQLSATPSRAPDFSLAYDDRHDACLARRLTASKLARLIEVADRKKLAQVLAEQALKGCGFLVRQAETARIAVVVNRVATAREVFERLAERLKDKAEVVLLVGRSRPLERDELMQKFGLKLKARPTPREGDKPIVVVATQTIEVGADFDFHALYTESASYQALRQRFGRLNRLGLHSMTDAAIVHSVKEADADPVYGKALSAAWQYLLDHARNANGTASVDLGLDAAPPLVAELMQPTPATPLLTPAIVGLFAQTNPQPVLDPDCAPYLHGFSEQEAEVQVVWRSGLREDGEIDSERANAVLELLPPLSLEALPLPRSTLLSWLGKETRSLADEALSDLEAAYSKEERDADRKVLVQRQDKWRVVPVHAVRPGETVIVAVEEGGCDQYGFAPKSKDVAKDLSELARERAGRRAVMVLTADRIDGWRDIEADTRAALQDVLETALDGIRGESMTVREVASALMHELAEGKLSAVLQAVVSNLGDRPVVEALMSEKGIFGLGFLARRPRPEDFAEEETALQRTVNVTLPDHSRGVGELAKRFAHQVRLPPALTSDLALAGVLHDFGKAEPRFQQMLGSSGPVPLAKAELGSEPKMTPSPGARHECYSVSLIDQNPEVTTAASDRALVRHLVGSHHGRGRAWQPATPDAGVHFRIESDGITHVHEGAPGLGAVDSGWVEQFAALNRRYGAWGLAYLESLLRLADHRCSQNEMRKTS